MKKRELPRRMGVEQSWFGFDRHRLRTLKSPADLMSFQELFFKVKLDLIIETGTNTGGSALF